MTVFQASDIKGFLNRYLQGLPKRGRGESSRIASALSISTTLMSQFLTGERVPTSEQTFHLSNYLGLSPVEADYLNFMVQFERAGSAAHKKYWKTKLDEIKSRSMKLATRVQADRHLTDQERSVFYSSPHYSAIQLYTSVGKNGKSAAEICERFDLPRPRVTEILRFLTETGLCLEKSDRYSLGNQKTHLERGNPHLSRHHVNWRILAAHQCEELDASELMYTAQVSLSKDDFAGLREKMVEFIKQFLNQVHDSPAEEIAAFNLDFFWIKK